MARGVGASPGRAGLSGAVSGTAAFAPVDGREGVYQATVGSGALDPGPASATATVDGRATADSVAMLALAADDQAPGVELVGGGDDAWRRVDSVDGHDLDDVDAVTLAKGDRQEVAVASLSADPVAARLFQAGTDDVLGRLDRALPCGTGPLQCPANGLTFKARPSAPTCWTCSPPGRAAATGSPGRCTARPACPSRSRPRPHDGDRDTTVFAMTSSEPGRLRVVISRPGGAQVRVLRSGPRAAGRQRVGWTGRTSSGAWVRGRFWYVIDATDAASNTSRSARHQVQAR